MKINYIIFCTLFNFYASLDCKINFTAIAFGSIGITGLYGLYCWITKPPPFELSLEALHTLTIKPAHTISESTQPLIDLDQFVHNIYTGHIPSIAHIPLQPLKKPDPSPPVPVITVKKGISLDIHDNIIFIFSRGYARETKPLGKEDVLIQKGGCIIGGYAQFRDHIINASPCITFDYPDSSYYFNFAQTLDLNCLDLVYQQTLRIHPNAQIILVGDCRGAKCVLSFAARNPKNLKALILISPFISARQLTDQLAKNYLSWIPGGATLLHSFFKWYFPQYDPEKDQLLDEIGAIAPTLPIFIGHRKGDTLVSDSHMFQLIEKLKATGHTQLHTAIIDDSSALHSRLTPVKNFQIEVNKFLRLYDLPHDPLLLNNITIFRNEIIT